MHNKAGKVNSQRNKYETQHSGCQMLKQRQLLGGIIRYYTWENGDIVQILIKLGNNILYIAYNCYYLVLIISIILMKD